MVLLVRRMGATPLNHIRPLTTYLLSIKLILFKAVLLVRRIGATPLNHIRPLTTYLLSIKLVLFKAIILGYVT